MHLLPSSEPGHDNLAAPSNDTSTSQRFPQSVPRLFLTERNWSCLRGLPGAAMAAVTSERKVVLVREFRPNVAGRHVPTWNLPRGAVEHGETAIDAALREFTEETGLELDARQAHVLGDVRADNGLILQSVTLCWAPLASTQDVWPAPTGSEEQILEVQAFDLSTLRRMLSRGELQDSYLFSAIGLMHLSGLL